MARLLLMLFLFGYAVEGYAQNLIQNPSFEDTVARPLEIFKARYWKSANDGTPDIFTPYNTLFPSRLSPKNFVGFQEPKSGKNYAGLQLHALYNEAAVSFREYLQNELAEPLVADSNYCFRIHLSLGDSSNYASRGIFGLYFTSDAIYQSGYTRIRKDPDVVISEKEYVYDKENWLQYDVQFRASGGERFLTLGNFWSNAIVDTSYLGGGLNSFFKHSYYYFDDLYLGFCDSTFDFEVPIEKTRYEEPLKIFPNPVSDVLQVYYQGNEDLQFRVYDKIGREVFPIEVEKVYGGYYRISLLDLPGGLYILKANGPVLKKSVKAMKVRE